MNTKRGWVWIVRSLLGIALCVVLASPDAKAGDPVRRPGPAKGPIQRVRGPDARSTPFRGLIPARPKTAAEREFVAAYAKEIESATVRVVSQPSQRFARGTLEAHIRAAFLKVDAPTRAAMQQRAQAMVAKRSVERRRVPRGPVRPRSGPVVRRPGVRPPRARRPAVRSTASGLSADLKAKLRRAVSARLDALLGDLPSVGQAGSSSAAPQPSSPIPSLPESKTWVEVGHFSKEIVTAGRREITIHHPAKLEFRWWTEEAGAEQGRWELRGPPTPAVVLASGIAGDAPKSTFKVDLRTILPKTPPTTPHVYTLSVVPWTKPSISKSPGATPRGGGVVKKPAERAGVRSAPVLITYVASHVPPQTFDFPKVYRTLSFHPDKLHMVDDQTGPGAEEFYLAGFIQEGLATGPGQQRKFGPYLTVLHPDGPRWGDLNGHWDFHLNNPDQPQWPRFYSCVISILEEDCGDLMADWLSSVWSAAHAILSSEIYEIVKGYLEDFLKEHGEEALEEGIQWGSQAAQWIAMAASEASVTIVGMVVAAAAMVIAAIVAGAEDDYYGTEAFTLPLLSNDTKYVQGSPGKLLPNGRFRLNTEKLLFKGYAAYPSASAWDGVVEVLFHFEFEDPVDRQ